jgi:hypothetical protein
MTCIYHVSIYRVPSPKAPLSFWTQGYIEIGDESTELNTRDYSEVGRGCRFSEYAGAGLESHFEVLHHCAATLYPL